MTGRSNSTLDSSETQDYYLSFVIVGQQRHNAYLLSGYIGNSPKVIGIKALFDSGADVTIINQRVVDKYQLPIKPLLNSIRFRNADGSTNAVGTVTHKLDANFIVQEHSLPTTFYIADLGRNNALSRMPWIQQYNPIVDWVNGTFQFNPKQIQHQQRLAEQ